MHLNSERTFSRNQGLVSLESFFKPPVSTVGNMVKTIYSLQVFYVFLRESNVRESHLHVDHVNPGYNPIQIYYLMSCKRIQNQKT